MGKTYEFACGLCHYRTKVSGGADSGVDCAVQTVTCPDCRELFDVFTRVRQREGAVKLVKFPGFYRPEIPPPHLRDPSVKPKWVWQKVSLACPVGPKHVVAAWKDPGRCPRCGSFMERNGFPTKIWD